LITGDFSFFYSRIGLLTPFQNRGIARTRVESVSNHSFKAFSNWEQAVRYYSQCYTDDCIEIRDPKLPKSQPRSSAEVAPPALRSHTTPKPHGVGTESRPITVTPSSPTSHRVGTESRPITTPSDAPLLTTEKALNSKTRIKKGKAKSDGRTVVVSSSDSEDIPDILTRPVTKPKIAASPAPVIGSHRQIVIIDDAGEEIELSDTDGKPSRRTKRYRMAVHTMRVKQPMPRLEIPSTSKAIVPGQPVPLPVRLYSIAVNPSEAGLVPLPAAGPSHSKVKNGTNNHGEDSEYEVTDIEPELLAALCKGL